MLENDLEFFPEKYGENYLYILEVDQQHVHVFWEVNPEILPDHVLNDTLYLKIFYMDEKNSEKSISSSIDFHAQGFINNWFVELKEPLLKCHAQLGYYEMEKHTFIPLCQSDILEGFTGSDLRQVLVGNDEYNTNAISHSSAQTRQGMDELSNGTIRIDSEAPDEERGILPDRDNDRHGDLEKLMKSITDREIIDYYRALPKRPVSSFHELPPWRTLLHMMSLPDHTLNATTTKSYTPLDFCLQEFNACTETYSSI